MNKRITVVIAVLLCVSAAAFAAGGDIRVGAAAGYGADWFSLGNDSGQEVFSNGGLYVSVDGSYDIADGISVDLSAGFMTMGKCVLSYREDGDEPMSITAEEITDPCFSLYLGPSYRFNITKEFSVTAGAGFDMMLGGFIHPVAESMRTNGRIGAGAQVRGSYSVADRIEVVLGARYSYYFINTNEVVQSNIDEVKKTDAVRSFQSGLKVFAGATYTL
jgi:hypothetical protein